MNIIINTSKNNHHTFTVFDENQRVKHSFMFITTISLTTYIERLAHVKMLAMMMV